MKAIMLSIQPKWCELIANGKKTVEVRKTRPKIETPFKVYVYCTKDYSLGEFYTSQDDFASSVQGKVIGEFVCDEIYNIIQYGFFAKVYTDDDLKNAVEPSDFFKISCLSREQIFEYLGEKDGYAWHISNLVIYDKPKELSEFKHYKKFDWWDYGHHTNKPQWELRSLTRPFQSWGYVEEIKGC